ncbi:MAG: IPT/TIG domain-containing protein, partial [Pseudomonadota bacterium]
MNNRLFVPLSLLLLLAAGCGTTPGGGNPDDGGQPVVPDAGVGENKDGSPPSVDDAGSTPSGDLMRIDFIDPNHGPFAGGTEVTIRGRGFAVNLGIMFGDRYVDPLDIEIVDNRRIIVKGTPPGDPGLADVVIFTEDGPAAEKKEAFRYEAIHVDPPNGSVAGGTFVRVKGFGTKFAEGDTVTFGDNAMANPVVTGEQEIVGFAPPGIAGAVDVTVAGSWGSITATSAYAYLDTSDPFAGGLGGGPINGTLNVTVINSNTNDGVPGAWVDVSFPDDVDVGNYTNEWGEVTFSAPSFVGPVKVTAALGGFEMASIMVFDSQDVTIFLKPVPPPVP